MPLLFIRTTNSKYKACDDGHEYDHPEAALALGVQAAVAMIADEISDGERSAAIEVSAERMDGTQLLRSVVAVSVSPLILVARPAR